MFFMPHYTKDKFFTSGGSSYGPLLSVRACSIIKLGVSGRLAETPLERSRRVSTITEEIRYGARPMWAVIYYHYHYEPTLNRP
jgi:hypothetical protein